MILDIKSQFFEGLKKPKTKSINATKKIQKRLGKKVQRKKRTGNAKIMEKINPKTLGLFFGDWTGGSPWADCGLAFAAAPPSLR